MSVSGLKKIIIALTLSLCASAAMAQYVWLNEKGVKQYSDQPPPASVPSSKILKAPGGVPRSDAPVSDAPAADSDAAKKAAPQSLADKNAEFQKRRAEQAEKDKKADDQAKQDAAKKTNCERARNYQQALNSGQRVSRMNKNGEREYLSDEERAKEEGEAKRALADCK